MKIVKKFSLPLVVVGLTTPDVVTSAGVVVVKVSVVASRNTK